MITWKNTAEHGYPPVGDVVLIWCARGLAYGFLSADGHWCFGILHGKQAGAPIYALRKNITRWSEINPPA